MTLPDKVSNDAIGKWIFEMEEEEHIPHSSKGVALAQEIKTLRKIIYSYENIILSSETQKNRRRLLPSSNKPKFF